MAEGGPAPFIRIEGVSKRFGTFTAVNDVSLDIMKGEMFALLGGSGCGKNFSPKLCARIESEKSLLNFCAMSRASSRCCF